MSASVLQPSNQTYHADKTKERLWTASSALACVHTYVDVPESEEIGREPPTSGMDSAAIVLSVFCATLLSSVELLHPRGKDP